MAKKDFKKERGKKERNVQHPSVGFILINSYLLGMLHSFSLNVLQTVGEELVAAIAAVVGMVVVDAAGMAVVAVAAAVLDTWAAELGVAVVVIEGVLCHLPSVLVRCSAAVCHCE